MTRRNPIFAIWRCTKFTIIMGRIAVHFRIPKTHVGADQDPRRRRISHRRLQGDSELTYHPPERF